MEPTTTRERTVLAVSEPEAPVRVTLNVPMEAALLADSVSALVPVAGFGLNEAVTPPGRPDAAKFTLPANPFQSFTVIVAVPEAPRLMLRLAGEIESVKPGTGAPPNASIRFCPLGLPHPVTRS